jgi:hypothetical protein
MSDYLTAPVKRVCVTEYPRSVLTSHGEFSPAGCGSHRECSAGSDWIRLNANSKAGTVCHPEPAVLSGGRSRRGGTAVLFALNGLRQTAGMLRGVYPECSWACGPPKQMKIADVVTPA